MSLEIWFRPKRIWDSGTLLAFYEPRNLFQFSLRQSQTTLLVKATPNGDRYHARTLVLYIDEALHRSNRPVFLSITAGDQGTSVYLDGRLAKATTEFPLSAKNVTGHLILGDSPGQSDSWSGEIRSLAIYNCALTSKQVFDHYSAWVHTGRPEITGDEQITALYLFQERRGVVARNQVRSGVDLYIPKKYQVMEKITLEPFWTEFEMTRSYWGAVLKNIVGFIPLGFWFYAYLTVLRPRKASHTSHNLPGNHSQPHDRSPSGIPSDAGFRHHGYHHEYHGHLGWRGALQCLNSNPVPALCVVALPSPTSWKAKSSRLKDPSRHMTIQETAGRTQQAVRCPCENPPGDPRWNVLGAMVRFWQGISKVQERRARSTPPVLESEQPGIVPIGTAHIKLHKATRLGLLDGLPHEQLHGPQSVEPWIGAAIFVGHAAFILDREDAGCRLAFMERQANFRPFSKTLDEISKPRERLGGNLMPTARQYSQSVKRPQ